MSYSATKTFFEYKLENMLESKHPDWALRIPLVKFNGNGKKLLKIEVQEGLPFRRNIGRRYFESVPGLTQIEVTVPNDSNSGTKELDTVISNIKALFQEVSVKLLASNSRLRIQMVSWTNEGVKSDRLHYTVTIPWVRDNDVAEVRDMEFG